VSIDPLGKTNLGLRGFRSGGRQSLISPAIVIPLRFFPSQALDYLAFKFRELAALAFQQLLDIARALLGQMLAADHIVSRQVWVYDGKPIGQRRSDWRLRALMV
jgi:hypothetical protein